MTYVRPKRRSNTRIFTQKKKKKKNLQLMSYVLGLQDTLIFFFKRMRLKFHFLLGYVWLEVKYGG